MPTVTCNSCGATYNTIEPDGTIYFHACGPIPNPAYQPNPAKPNFDSRPTVERANKRDENIPANLMYIEGKPFLVSRDPNDATRQVQTPAVSLMKAEGDGVTPAGVAPPPIVGIG